MTRDKDSGDCRSIKRKMAQKVQNSGKMDKTLIRIACHELESFYLGDLSAVEKEAPPEKHLKTTE